VERSRKFYEVLGFTLTSEQHGSGPRLDSTRVGESVLEFYPDAVRSTRGRHELIVGVDVSPVET